MYHARTDVLLGPAFATCRLSLDLGTIYSRLPGSVHYTAHQYHEVDGNHLKSVWDEQSCMLRLREVMIANDDEGRANVRFLYISRYRSMISLASNRFMDRIAAWPRLEQTSNLSSQITEIPKHPIFVGIKVHDLMQTILQRGSIRPKHHRTSRCT